MPDPLIEHLKSRLRQIMEEQDCRPAPLARAAQLNESAVRDILQGRSQNPGVVTLAKIARALNKRTSELLDPDTPQNVIGTIVDDGQVLEEAPSERVFIRASSPVVESNTVAEFDLYKVETDRLEPYAFNTDFVLVEKQQNQRPGEFGRPHLISRNGYKSLGLPITWGAADKVEILALNGRGRETIMEEDVFFSKALGVVSMSSLGQSQPQSPFRA